jgi:hypothetical protein
MVQYTLKQPLFAVEMVMDQRFVRLGNFGNLSDRGRIKSHFPENPICGP